MRGLVRHASQQLSNLGGLGLSNFVSRIAKLSIGSAGTQFAGVILVPVLTHSLSRRDFGLWDLMQFTFALGIIALILESGSIIAKRLAEHAGSRPEQSRDASAGLMTVLAVSAIALLAYPFGLQSLAHLWLPGAPAVALWLLPVAIATSAWYQQTNTIVQYSGSVGLATGIGLASLAIYVCMAVALVFSGAGLTGLLLARIFSNLVACAGAAIVVRDLLKPSTNALHAIPGILRASLPLLPYSVSLFLMTYGDRLFLVHYVRLDDIGVYSLAVRLNGAANGLILAVTVAYGLQFYSQAKRIHNPELARLTRLAAWLVAAIVLLFAEYADIAIYILAPRSYSAASAYAAWLIAGQGFYGVLGLFWIELVAVEDTWFIGAATTAVAAFNLAGNALLIPTMGVSGAAIAQFVAYFVLMAGSALYLRYRGLLIDGAPTGIALSVGVAIVIISDRIGLGLGLGMRTILVGLTLGVTLAVASRAMTVRQSD
jgi:O-antigen/teichoic acid export membrane protein